MVFILRHSRFLCGCCGGRSITQTYFLRYESKTITLRRERKLTIGRFVFELIIVFIGVYGAFELNRYQQVQREEEVREKYFITFRSELNKLVASIKQIERSIDRELAELENNDDSLRNKPFIPANILFNESLLITQAGLNADVFVQLSPDLAASLIGGYDYVKALEILTSEYNRVAMDKLYALKWSDLYVKNGSLKTEYVWYRSKLRNLKANFSQVGNMMENQAGPFVDQIIAEFD